VFGDDAAVLGDHTPIRYAFPLCLDHDLLDHDHVDARVRHVGRCAVARDVESHSADARPCTALSPRALGVSRYRFGHAPARAATLARVRSTLSCGVHHRLVAPAHPLVDGCDRDAIGNQKGSVIGHEWGHVMRRDPLRVALLRGCRDVLWFLPIVGAFAQDSTRVMEDAADDVAVALTDQPLELAAALVKKAKAQVPLKKSPTPALGGEHVVTERVERLLQVTPVRPPRWHARSWSISFVAVMCLPSLFILSRHPVAEVPSPESAELCARKCAPVSTLPPAPVVLPVLAFNLPYRLPSLRWLYESENIVLPLVVRRVWFTRWLPSPCLFLS